MHNPPPLRPGRRLRLRLTVAAGLLTLMAACGGGGSSEPAAPPDARISAVLDDLINVALNAQEPGRGHADYPGADQVDIPKADAMVLKAALSLPAAPERLAGMGRRSLQRLTQGADLDGDGVPGWGLPVAWDAFGEGTVNPANTVYAISTGIVIDALLDQAGVQGGAARDAIASQTLAAITPFMDPSIRTPGGLAPYSLTPQDRAWDVFNTAVYLGAMAQRLSREPALAARSAALQAFADETMQGVLDAHLISPSGAWYWPYLLPGASVNDLPHAAYMIYSIESYARHGGRLASRFDRPAMWQHLREFIPADGSAYVRAYPGFRAEVGPARLYDLSFALLTLCTFGDPVPEVREALLASMSDYRLDDGHYAKYPVRGPGAKAGAAEVITEYEAYLLAATSACRAAGS